MLAPAVGSSTQLKLTHTHRVAAVQAAGGEKSLPAILLQIVTSQVKHCNKLVPCRNCGLRNTFPATPPHRAVTSFPEIWRRRNIPSTFGMAGISHFTQAVMKERCPNHLFFADFFSSRFY